MDLEITKAVEVLRKGGVILYPTDTIWGIGCDATNPEAVKKIFSIKGREVGKSMLILLDDSLKLGKYIREIPEMAIEIFELSTSPITIILPGAINLCSDLLAEDGSIGVRITNEEFSKSLIRKFNKPIVSTSANFTGEKSPGNFSEISQKIIDAVDYTVDYGREETSIAKASSIVKIGLNSEIKIIRN
ncbi:MAG: threonylcarbamoyl-AMP synthase [Bacteroidales bacterium]|nr:threonylcarbamoyl-AMP synthase [Bacteroidales bacterium]